jgi:hypothetical protein
MQEAQETSKDVVLRGGGGAGEYRGAVLAQRPASKVTLSDSLWVLGTRGRQTMCTSHTESLIGIGHAHWNRASIPMRPALL